MKRFLIPILLIAAYFTACDLADVEAQENENDVVKFNLTLSTLPADTNAFSVYFGVLDESFSFITYDTSIVTVYDTVAVGDTVEIVERDSTVIEEVQLMNYKVGDVSASDANSTVTFTITQTNDSTKPGFGIMNIAANCLITMPDNPNRVYLGGAMRNNSVELSSESDLVTELDTVNTFTAKGTYTITIE
ncbi:MAG: hypothetical protein GF419_11795 [Ignavibacteriales bacterium]|nr:hypothetical protein [Ignavibacteriales bacterium]